MAEYVTRHEFNSRWWGAPVGIVTDAAFFSLPTQRRKEVLEPFEWAEFKSPLEDDSLDYRAVHDTGFFQVDTQINYRLRLPPEPRPDSLERLEVQFASETPFRIGLDDIASFRHERYFRLPGITEEKVNQRYVDWSNEQIDRSPHCCLRVLHEGAVAGWYLGDDAAGQGLHLTLAMLASDAKLSGFLLFLKAYEAYAQHGHRMGWAAFSVSNTPVHNIYAAIGARFIRPTACWIWLPELS